MTVSDVISAKCRERCHGNASCKNAGDDVSTDHAASRKSLSSSRVINKRQVGTLAVSHASESRDSEQRKLLLFRYLCGLF